MLNIHTANYYYLLDYSHMCADVEKSGMIVLSSVRLSFQALSLIWTNGIHFRSYLNISADSFIRAHYSHTWFPSFRYFQSIIY